MACLWVYVIGGFLGSGKTTLLKRLLAHELDRGVTPAVLMNEFGEMDIDGSLLHDHQRSADIELRELLSGCICCDLSDDLTQTLRELVGASRDGSIFVETTGLANVGQVAEAVMRALVRSPQEERPAQLAAVVAVVDTPRFRHLIGRWSEAEAQFAHVDTVILNKIDETDGRTVTAVERHVRRLNRQARILRALYADVAPSTILHGRKGRCSDSFRAVTAVGPTKDSTRGFTSLTLRILSPFDLAKLEELLQRYRGSVYRLKGFVRTTSHRGLLEVQWVPGTLTAQPYSGPPRQRANVVVIGQRVPWERFLEAMDGCTVPRTRRAGHKRDPLRSKPD